jgi:hypothetical protein
MQNESLTSFRREPVSVKGGYQETVMRVGAYSNKLDELAEVILPLFDSEPAFKKKGFTNDGKDVPLPEAPNTEYWLEGKVHGVKYIVQLQHVGCPVPLSMAEIHHASVMLPQERDDELTPVIEVKLREYEDEMNRRMDRRMQFTS